MDELWTGEKIPKHHCAKSGTSMPGMTDTDDDDEDHNNKLIKPQIDSKR